MPIVPTVSNEFDFELTQLTESLSSIKPTITGPIHKFIQKNHGDVKNVKQQQTLYIFKIFILLHCCAHSLKYMHWLPAATYHASFSFYISSPCSVHQVHINIEYISIAENC